MGFLSLVATGVGISGCASTGAPTQTSQTARTGIADIVAPESLIERSLSDRWGRPLAVDADTRREHGLWLLLAGTIEDVGGTELDRAGVFFESRFIALLKRPHEGAPHTLLELDYGASDSPYDQWLLQYPLPTELLDGYTGSEALQWQ